MVCSAAFESLCEPGYFFVLIFCALPALSDVRVEREEVRASGKQGTFIPYAFSSDSQGTALGVSYLAADVIKPGTSWIVAGHVTDKDGQFLSTFFLNNPALRGYFSLDPDSVPVPTIPVPTTLLKPPAIIITWIFG